MTTKFRAIGTGSLTRARLLREAAGLRRSGLAERADVAESTLWMVERFGVGTPAVLQKIASALGVTPAELVGTADITKIL